MLKAIVAIFLISLSNVSVAQPLNGEAPQVYKAHRAKKPPVINGIIQKKEWDNATWSNLFVDIEGAAMALPVYTTKVKMLWNDSTLFILAQLQEPNMMATLLNHDDIIYRDNDFEVFVDPDNDTDNYYEIEVNTYGTIMDLFMNKPYKKGGHFDMKWDASKLTCAIGKMGTINQPNDVDTGWVVEMAFPINTFEKNINSHLPLTQQTWRINFSRVQWQFDVINGSYKKREENGKPMKENNWVWSPMGVIDMHYPDRWGYLTFTD